MERRFNVKLPCIGHMHESLIQRNSLTSYIHKYSTRGLWELVTFFINFLVAYKITQQCCLSFSSGKKTNLNV